MNMKSAYTRVAAVALIASMVTPAFAAGNYPGYDPSTDPYYSAYVPTGNEFVPMDTQLSQGINPATIGLMGYQIAGVSGGQFRNALVGGDFGVNPWQRGIAASADIANTLTYYADQWWNLGGASSAINVTKVTTAAELVPGSAAVLKFQRKASNGNTAAICTGQVLTSGASTRFQGQTAIFSASLKSGANFSPAASNVNITVAYGTGANESAANFASGAWTGYAAAYTGATTITPTMARYSVAAAIPATATQVGVKICYTPVGSAGANDWFEMGNAQLEASGAVLPSSSALTLSQYALPSTFAYRHPQIELALAEHYFYRITEGTPLAARGLCRSRTTGTCSWDVKLPVVMRASPTIVTSTAGFAVETTVAGGTLNACTTLAADTTVSTTVSSPTDAYILCTASTVPAAGTVDQVYDDTGSGTVSLSAEL